MSSSLFVCIFASLDRPRLPLRCLSVSLHVCFCRQASSPSVCVPWPTRMSGTCLHHCIITASCPSPASLPPKIPSISCLCLSLSAFVCLATSLPLCFSACLLLSTSLFSLCLRAYMSMSVCPSPAPLHVCLSPIVCAACLSGACFLCCYACS